MKKGWHTKTLGDVCHVYQPETISQKQMAGGEFPVYGANGQIGWHNQFNHDEPQLILGCRGSCGSVHFTKPCAWINGNAMVVQPKVEVIDISYLAYALKGGIELADAITGTAQPQITRTSLTPLVISFPESIPEQQRIVALLDEAFAGLATAKANAERNLQNAREVFEGHLEAVFANCPDRWISRPLADCLELITYGFTNPMPTAPSGPFMITAKNVIGGRIDYSSTRHTSQEAFEALLTDKSRPRIGDVLLTKDGTLGRVAVVDKRGTCINQSVALLRANHRMIPHFMRFLLSSRGYQKQMIDDAGGTTIKHIYITRVDKMPIVFPDSAEEQAKIVCELNTLAAECKRLEQVYERKLATLEELKKSLLQQAFNGNL